MNSGGNNEIRILIYTYSSNDAIKKKSFRSIVQYLASLVESA